MKWENKGRSRNLEDRRGRGPVTAGVPLGIGGVLVLLVLSLLFGTDLFSLLGITPSQVTQQGVVPRPEANASQEQLVDFVSFVLDDVQADWARMFETNGLNYRDAKLVLYDSAVQSACGVTPSSVGPFYCPNDDSVYLDLSFYGELRQRFGAPGDFAQAYVIAHELGHHVQDLLGTFSQVQRLENEHPGLANELSVDTELQADCFAGVWGASAQAEGILERGDLEEGLTAAAAVGDDRLQRAQTGSVNPDTFTHGSSQQRVHWFRAGFASGNPDACDTFSAAP